MAHKDHQLVYLKNYTAPSYWVDKIDLNFTLDAMKTNVRSTMQCRKNKKNTNSEFVLDGVGLELLSIAIDGVVLKQEQYSLNESDLRLNDLPDYFELAIENTIVPMGNSNLLGLYQTEGNLCTHCEADGFRRITFFPDRPDILARYTTTLVADKNQYPILLANGNPYDREQLSDGKHSITWHDPFPKPSYLFALVAGKFACINDSYATSSGRQITVNIYADETVIDDCQFAMSSIKQAMVWDEQQYHREYDLNVYNIVTVADHNFGAMENKGLTIYSPASIVANGSAPATDDDYKLIRINTAHEHFHNWSGNRVTCRDWFQLSLKEGFTTYRHCQYEEDVYGKAASRIGQVRTLRSKQFAEDSSANAHCVQPKSYLEVSNFYTLTIYNKGSEIVRMLHTLLGDKDYYRGCDIFFTENDGQAVTIEEYIAAMEQASGKDLAGFRRWYQQLGTPEIDVIGEYDDGSNCYTLTIKQRTKPLHIPLKLGLLDSLGNDMALQLEGEQASLPGSRVLEIKQAVEVFNFINIEEKPVPSLLRDFSAPVRLTANLSNEDLHLLVVHDSNHFNRWDAIQQLYVRLLKGDDRETLSKIIVKSFAELFDDTSLDKAVLAELISIPLERELLEMSATINVEAICETQDKLSTELAKNHREKLLQLYHKNSCRKQYRPEPEDIACRSLRNQCLSLLMVLDNDQEVLALCFEQAVNSDNMTDVIAALTLINNIECPQRQQALDTFYNRWKNNPLAIDKWFQVQAQTRLPTALLQVQQLMQHPAFDMSRPDRVKALFAWFFGFNFRSFHNSDGSTYHFFVDILLMIDQINPTAVAWLFRKSDFVRWQRFDQPRQQLMKTQMQRILTHEPLSKGLHELVSKCLA